MFTKGAIATEKWTPDTLTMRRESDISNVVPPNRRPALHTDSTMALSSQCTRSRGQQARINTPFCERAQIFFINMHMIAVLECRFRTVDMF